MPFERLGEKCGVFGVYGKGLEAARMTYPGLWALQHRGQESSGIASTGGDTIRSHIRSGLVAHAYQESDLDRLLGHIAIGHNRYSTSGGGSDEHNQPVIRPDHLIALAHNGNLPSTKALVSFLKSQGVDTAGSNDSELMTDAIRHYYHQGLSLEESVKRAYPLFTGAFALLVMDKHKLVAVRDNHGIRPLSIARAGRGWAFSSETCAFDTIGAMFLRDVEPGEVVVADEFGLRSEQLEEGQQKLDIFEFVYFARPDSHLLGKSVNEVRRNFGMLLGREHPIKADVVIPVPDSAIPAALGYAAELGIPFDHGLVKNRYIHRTFIRPAQRLRDRDIQMKLNPLPEVLAGKDVVVIDDSIVRGSTTRKLVAMIRAAGAKKVHMMSSSPPVKYPDFYGIDTPKQKDLIAAKLSVEAIRQHIGADTLAYLSYEGMIQATGISAEKFSTSCFNGVYPVDIAERAREVVPV